jgi:hypothetical protein
MCGAAAPWTARVGVLRTLAQTRGLQLHIADVAQTDGGYEQAPTGRDGKPVSVSIRAR